MSRFILPFILCCAVISARALPTTIPDGSTIAAGWLRSGQPLTLTTTEAERFIQSDEATTAQRLGRPIKARERRAYREAQRRLRRALQRQRTTRLPSARSRGFGTGFVLGFFGFIYVLPHLLILRDRDRVVPIGFWRGYVLGAILMMTCLIGAIIALRDACYVFC